MEFIKKNWGLLICMVIFLAGAIYLTVQILARKNEYAASEQKIAEHKAWFQKVNSDGWKITAENGRLENVATAQANQALAEEHLKQIRDELIRKYSFIVELPRNDADAKDRLDRRLKNLSSLVINAKVQWEAEYMGGALYEMATQSEKINHEDFKPVFRQLEIYERVTRDIVASGVKEVTLLSFPRKWSVEENGDYTITPVLVSVVASPEVLQKFVNQLLTDPKMLCIIRGMEFHVLEAEGDEYNEIVLGSQQEEEQLNADPSGEQREGGANAGLTSSSRRSRRNSEQISSTSSRTSRRSRSSDLAGEFGGMGGTINEEDLVPEDPKRQDYLVFKTPRKLELRLNLDVIEYIDTEAAAEE